MYIVRTAPVSLPTHAMKQLDLNVTGVSCESLGEVAVLCIPNPIQSTLLSIATTNLHPEVAPAVLSNGLFDKVTNQQPFQYQQRHQQCAQSLKAKSNNPAVRSFPDTQEPKNSLPSSSSGDRNGEE